MAKPEMRERCPLELEGQRGRQLAAPFDRDKKMLVTPSREFGDQLVPIVLEHRRELAIEFRLVRAPSLFDGQRKARRTFRARRPGNVLAETQFHEIRDPQRNMEQEFDRQRDLHQGQTALPGTAIRQCLFHEHCGKVQQRIDCTRTIKARQKLLVLLGEARRKGRQFAAQPLQLGNLLRWRFDPLPRDADQRLGHHQGEMAGLALCPLMKRPKDHADHLGSDEIPQGGQTLGGDAVVQRNSMADCT